MSNSSKYIPYVEAFRILSNRLNTTKEEFAGWIFFGAKDGGLDAYKNASDLAPDAPKPPRFFFSYHEGEREYLQLLPQLWFDYEDILNFNPSNEVRLLTFGSLLSRWDQIPGTTPTDYIKSKIADSSLMDIHPTFGGTQTLNSEDNDFPTLEEGLFFVSQVLAAEETELKHLMTVELKPEIPNHQNQSEILHSTNAEPEAEFPFPPQRSNDWYLAIRESRLEFYAEHKRPPSMQEAWSRLCQKPPIFYGIQTKSFRNELALCLDNNYMTKDNFKERWERYTGTKGQY